MLTLLSMMNCAVHQVLKILLKITLVISSCVIYFTVATVQSNNLDVFNRERYVLLLLWAFLFSFYVFFFDSIYVSSSKNSSVPPFLARKRFILDISFITIHKIIHNYQNSWNVELNSICKYASNCTKTLFRRFDNFVFQFLALCRNKITYFLI